MDNQAKISRAALRELHDSFRDAQSEYTEARVKMDEAQYKLVREIVRCGHFHCLTVRWGALKHVLNR